MANLALRLCTTVILSSWLMSFLVALLTMIGIKLSTVGYLSSNRHHSTPCYFRQNDIMDTMLSWKHRRLPYGQSKSSRSIPMPWVIPPWLVLVECLGLTAKEHGKHADNEVMIFTTMPTMATATSSTPTTRMAMMATTTTVKWTATVMTMTTTMAMTTMISTMTMTMTMR